MIQLKIEINHFVFNKIPINFTHLRIWSVAQRAGGVDMARGCCRRGWCRGFTRWGHRVALVCLALSVGLYLQSLWQYFQNYQKEGRSGLTIVSFNKIMAVSVSINVKVLVKHLKRILKSFWTERPTCSIKNVTIQYRVGKILIFK